MPELSTCALLCGFLLDLALGDPEGWPHIVRFFGALIADLEPRLRARYPKTGAGERKGGRVLVGLVLAVSFFAPLLLLRAAFAVSPWLSFALETLLCWQLLAVRSLKVESLAVYTALSAGDLPAARAALSRIVGRDTAALDEAGIARAAVETVAENTADGVIAPLFYLALGGAPLGCLYKAVNTMDSMLGYTNARYFDFGRCAAKTDDVFGFLPARISGGLLIAAAALCGYDAKNAYRVFLRDRLRHASPNSAHSEAACAGALGLRLGGNARYFGELHKKPTIGDALREIEPEDIRRAHRLLYAASFEALILALPLRLLGGALLHALL